MSTLSLAKNGHVSSSKQTKHIKAKYFFIRHYHNTGELQLHYCPTEEIWADVLTKPLQGLKFKKMRAFLMNCPVDYSEDPPFLPSSSSIHVPPLPTSTPSLAPMKSRHIPSNPSSRGCVGTQGMIVTWRDVVAPRVPT